MPTNMQTPGVYIQEVNAFPNSVVGVPTSIPVFIGYTPQATYEGKSYLLKPVQITSMAEFRAFFAYPSDPTTQTTPSQYQPNYHIKELDKQPAQGKFYTLNGKTYAIEPDPSTIYYLYNSVRLFYENGGGTAYIVSVGSYGKPSGNAKSPGDKLLNPNVLLSDLQAGLEATKVVPEITMYIFPEATLLSIPENGTLMQVALEQCGTVRTAMSIFDLIGGDVPDPLLWTDDISSFRNHTGNNFLQYGAAYYPFLKTTITSSTEVNYTNINGGDINSLVPIISPTSAPNENAVAIIKKIASDPNSDIQNQNSALINASKTYSTIVNSVLELVNILPPSGAMAGIYTMVDNNQGVWVAPANISPVAVSDVTIRINDQQQEGLNIDPLSGKSINAIRFFNGQGILVWGARTLDGNSQDWRYINVRRTVIMIEQSLQLALRAYIFEPNTADTWSSIKSSFESFLTNIWSEGALQGSTASSAFNVKIGLGTSMTAQDITDGIMRATVSVAISHPAEFIVLSIEQVVAPGMH